MLYKAALGPMMAISFLLLRPRRVAGSSHFFRSATVNAELPRGISAAYDVTFNEATQTIGPVQPLWPWNDQRVGQARHTAIASGSRLTVAGTGATAWTNFLAAVATYVAGSGDYEILVPAAMTMPWSGDFSWSVPSVTAGRRLYVTYVGTLPTADVMPSTAALNACSVWSGPATQITDNLIQWPAADSSAITFTGVVFRPMHNILYFGVLSMRNGSAMLEADTPRGVVLDRCWIDGSNTAQSRRGFLINGQQVAILESWFTDLRHISENTGIGGYSGSKYVYLRNVYCECEAINYLLGGSEPRNPNTGINDPSDWVFVNTVGAKKLAWMTENAGNAGALMKVNYEIKNGRRVLFLNSISHRNAQGGHSGHAMILQSLVDPNEINDPSNGMSDVVVYNHVFRDVPAGPSVTSRVNYGDANDISQMQPSARIALVNIRLENLGTEWGRPPGASNRHPITLNGDLQGVEVDRITWSFKPGFEGMNALSYSGATNIRLTNWSGSHAGLKRDIAGLGLTGLALYTSSYTWEGHSFFGTPIYDGGGYTPGATIYATAAAMGFDTTTLVISAPGNDDGVGGSVPGVNHAQLDAGIASMLTWAYSR